MKRVEELLKNFTNGKIVVVFDDENRENEADLIVAIDNLTPDDVNFLITHGKGLVCAALSTEIAGQKGLVSMPSSNTDPHSTAFTISVDSRSTRTGISPYERYVTAKDLIDPEKNVSDFTTPGHLFPLVAKDGGLLERRGHTEAAVTMCRWAGLSQGALICEMVNDSGKMYSMEEAKAFAEKYNLGFTTIDELVEYQHLNYPNVERVVTAKLPTDYGVFDITIYRELYHDKEHIFLSMGEDYKNGAVRIHSECFTGDVLSSRTCDCQSQLHAALERIAADGKGAIVYLRQEGRGIGLGEKIKAYALQQNNGLDTVEANLELGFKADQRDYHQAAWILKDQGFTEVKLMTNNPLKADGLKLHDLNVTLEEVGGTVHSDNYGYLLTKKNKMGHRIIL